MRIKFILSVLVLAGTAHADGPEISANPYAPNSTGNPYGIYGSPYSPVSVNNPYGQGIQLSPPPPPAPAPDFSGLSTLGAPGSGLQFKTDEPTVRPEPSENIIDALDDIRKAERERTR